MKRKWLAIHLVWLLLLIGMALSVQATPSVQEPAPPHLTGDPVEGSPFHTPSFFLPEPSGADLVPGSLLVFQSFRQPDNNWEIYKANDDGSDQTRLTVHNALDNYPRFNRGCSRVAFSSKRSEENLNIFTMNADGSGLKQLTFNQAEDLNPAWSPDGSQIVFVSKRDGNYEIYKMNAADGTAQTKLTTDVLDDVDPYWSPDGGRIVFASRRTGDYRIWVMNADGSGQTMLSNQPRSRNPVWSPDGRWIAYDADGNGDGRQELWVMNADGSDQHEVYDPGTGDVDAWARSWSPDARYIAFTRAFWFFDYDSGQWYVGASDLLAWDTQPPGGTVSLIATGMDQHPDWQTVDLLPPTTSVQALPFQTAGPFTVRWSGYDNGPAGLRYYDVQVKDGDGDWTDWQVQTTATAGTYWGVGGHTYSFRSRGWDHAYNIEPWPDGDAADAVTFVEAMAPRTAVKPLPDHCRGTQVAVSWGGSDPGGSGIAFYDVQYQDAAVGTWTDWHLGSTDTGDTFSGAAGHTYYFRSRGQDNALNLERWPSGNGDTAITLYTWAISGTATDNRGAPLIGAQADTIPAAFETVPSDAEGVYRAYVDAVADTYLATVGRAGYGALAYTAFDASRAGDLDVILPPADNSVQNWDFEAGQLPPAWTVGGATLPGVTETLHHTGDYVALLGCQQAMFGAPRNVSNMPGSSSYPQVAVDAGGVLHVVWYQNQGGGNVGLYYAQRSGGGVWTSPTLVTTVPGVLPGLQLTVDGSGALHVIWVQQEVVGNREVYYVRRATDGSWSTPEDVSLSMGQSENPRLAVGTGGIVHLVWQDNSTGTYQIYYRRRASDGSWSAYQQISNSTAGASNPRLIVSGSEVVHVVWEDLAEASGEPDVYHAWRSAPGNWSSPRNISADPEGSESPQLAMDGNGIVHAVWFKASGETSAIAYARRESSGNWSTPLTPLSTTGALDQLQVAMDAGNNLHGVWNNDLGASAAIGYIQRHSDGTWTPAQTLFQGAGWVNSLQLAVNAGGTLHVAWVQYASASQADVYYLHGESDSYWSNPQNVSHNSGASEQATMAVGANRLAHIVWADKAPGLAVVYYAGTAASAQTGDSYITQTVTVPAPMNAPTLSFLYQFDGAYTDGGSWLDVQVDDGLQKTTLFSTTTGVTTWTHRWHDLTPWAGQTLTLRFNVHQVAGQLCTWGYLEEVSVGSSYPDVWIEKSGPLTAMPGETVVYTIVYGNRGGADASSVRITDTLPSDLVFVAADPDPVSPTPPLRWEVGDVPARSGPYEIVVTATVDPATPVPGEFTNPVCVGTVSPEVHTADNTASVATYVGYRIYVPLVIKENTGQ